LTRQKTNWANQDHGEVPRSGRVVLYCDCPDEEIASVYTFLRTRGYENHFILEGGYREWLRRQYPVDRRESPLGAVKN
jgi:rhodanese-related sulfurtransferase